MTEVFADAAFWIALLSPRDSLFLKALELSRTIPPERIVTSELVLAEMLNTLGRRGPFSRSAAARTVEAFAKTGDTIVVPQTTEQFERALQRYERSSDKEWSLTDCSSFLIMEERGIRAALTHDQHFVQAGFDALLR
jgi:predicted nucleic acid-binding protein